MYDLAPHRCLIAVFTLEGCGHCEIYLPRLKARVEQLQKQGFSIELPEADQAPEGRAVLVMVYDLSKGDHTVQRFADRFQVEGTPTTVVLPRGHGAFKIDSSLSDSQIDRMLEIALRV